MYPKATRRFKFGITLSAFFVEVNTICIRPHVQCLCVTHVPQTRQYQPNSGPVSKDRKPIIWDRSTATGNCNIVFCGQSIGLYGLWYYDTNEKNPTRLFDEDGSNWSGMGGLWLHGGQQRRDLKYPLRGNIVCTVLSDQSGKKCVSFTWASGWANKTGPTYDLNL